MSEVYAEEPSTSASATVSKATVRAARALGLTNTAIAVILGLSEATISRLSAGTFMLDRDSKPYELAMLLVRLFRSLDAMVGGEEASMRGWMQSANAALGGVPAERIKTVNGLVETLSYVDGARARI